MNKVRVLCTADNGLFSNELNVRLKSINGEVSCFVDSGLVSHMNNKSYLLVNIVSTHNDYSTVLLPSEAFENGSRWVNVPSTALDKMAVAK